MKRQCRTRVVEPRRQARGALARFYGDSLEVWRPWAPDVRGRGIDASHFLVEDRPEEFAAELLGFLGEG